MLLISAVGEYRVWVKKKKNVIDKPSGLQFKADINNFVPDCSNSSALTME